MKYLKLLRIKHYIKNLFIFAPLFFGGLILNIELLKSAFIAFISFSLTASSIYILNDYLDIKNDQKHPTKKFRPLASGEVSKKHAFTIMVLLSISGFVIISIASFDAIYILGLYVLLNILYSFKLKHIAIIDVSIIAIGFVLRLFIGSIVTQTPLSTWIVIMTFLLALFLALAKRRDDVLIYLETGKKMRKVIDGYNLKLIDGAMMIMASVVIVSYIMFTTATDVLIRMNNEYLYLTTLFVIIGVLRYLQIIFIEKNSGSPTKIILQDRFLQIDILAWIASFIWILYK